MYRFILFTLGFFFYVSCHDLDDNLLKSDIELSTKPDVEQILVNTDFNIEIHVARDYSDECNVYFERQIGSGAFTPKPLTKISDMVYVDTTIDKEESKFYTFRYYISKGDYRTNFSDGDTITYISQTLNQPANLILVCIENQGVDLSWKDNSRVEDGFIIERNDGSGYTTIATLPTNSNFYQDRGIQSQPSSPLYLYYRVKAYKGTKQSSPLTNNTVYSGIGSPTNLQVTSSSSANCALKWRDNSQIENGFIIERKKDSGNFITVATKNSNDTVHTDTISSIGDYTYRVKAFSGINYSGYSNEILNKVVSSNSFVDPRDGKVYKTVTIGTQVWMAENLNYDTLNGTGSWYYNNNSAYAEYGRLYNWETAMKVAPPGWHLPSDDEWKTLELYLGMSQQQVDGTGWRGTDEGNKLKESGNTHWNSPSVGTNSSGFTALPGGYRINFGAFYNIGELGNFYSSTKGGSNPWYRGIYWNESRINRLNNDDGVAAFSVRCIKN